MTRAEELAEKVREGLWNCEWAVSCDNVDEHRPCIYHDGKAALSELTADAEALAEEAQKLKDGGWMDEFAGLRPLGDALARYRGEK